MTKYYIYDIDGNGTYKVSTDASDDSIATFDTDEDSQCAILREADQAMVINGLLDNKNPVSYIYC